MAKKTTTTQDKNTANKKTAPAKSTAPKTTAIKPNKTPKKAEVKKTDTKPATVQEMSPAVSVSPAVKVTIRQRIDVLRQAIILSLIVLIGLAATVMSGASQQIRWFYQTSDSLASTKGTVFVTGSKLILEKPYSLVLIVLLGIAVIYHALLLTVLKKSYSKAVANKIVPHRWLYIGISSALMMEILAMLHGVQDIALLKLMSGSIFVTALLGWVVERDNKAHQPSWRVYVVSLLTGCLPWLAIVGILLGTVLYGGVRLPWYVYALDGVTFLGFSGFAINQFLWIKQARGWRTYARVEWNYLLGDAFIKVAFAVVLIAGLLR